MGVWFLVVFGVRVVVPAELAIGVLVAAVAGIRAVLMGMRVLVRVAVLMEVFVLV